MKKAIISRSHNSIDLMMSTVIFTLILCCWSSYALATSALKGNETDQLALIQFKAKITHDPLQVLSSWNASNHFCHWQGVTCSHRHQRVVMLNLTSSRLEGSLSPFIGNLSFLRDLRLQENGFRGYIPLEIGYLFRLRFFSLTNNSFVGEIPVNISRCVNLEYIGLGNNQLVGKVPPELGSLSKLHFLYIFNNELSEEIPSSFGNLSSIEVLSGGGNQFVGRIPATLGQLRMMYAVSFHTNKLSGEIPSSIFNISSLMILSFPANQLHGSLPSELGFTLPNLQVISLYDNQFTGSIPASISNASNLMDFVIAFNRFSGQVPTLENLHNLRSVGMGYNQLGNGEEDDTKFITSLINATSLDTLEIQYNTFGGMLPEAIGNLSTTLNYFDMANNAFIGTIPTTIGKLVGLEILYLENNQFTGGFPHNIGKVHKLNELLLSGNKFSGEVPSSLGNLSLLTTLSLKNNNFQGSIPSSLGRCQNLNLLDISNNNLSGTIPKEVIGISSLSISLDLSRNQFTGSLPSSVGNLVNLVFLDVSENKLFGEIPDSLGNCITLNELMMKGNFFQGNIPSSLSALRGLSNLDLSRNNLSGQIPKYFDRFPFLKNFNLSYNDFEGEVPLKGVFKNVSAISLVGNDNLCGGIAELQFSSCPTKGSKQTQSPSLKMIIPTVVGILFLIGIVCLVIIYRWRKPKSDSSFVSPLADLVLQVSYHNLLKATDGFSSSNLVGSGGFGYVYRGILGDDEMTVAVKVLSLQHRGASKSFMAECETLRSIRHRNLVKIISACASVDFQGNDFKALVYEFMVNGSLEDWLHPNLTTQEEQRYLNLLERLNIMIDVACALNYLHSDCETPIAHCDLKPSNVLLDDKMIGHVGDFGLARFLLQSTNNSQTNETSSIGIRGTVGYAAPEYGMGSEVATHGDVYSYGILMLEMFTRKRPTDEMFNGNQNLHTFVKASLPEQVTEIVDPILLTREREEEETRMANVNNRRRNTRSYSITECLVSILGIAVSCSADLPRERMNMDDVVTQLCSIRNKIVKEQNIHIVQLATNVHV